MIITLNWLYWLFLFYIAVAKPTNSFVSFLAQRSAISINIRRRKCKTVLSHITNLADVVEFATVHSYLLCIPDNNSSISHDPCLGGTNRAFILNDRVVTRAQTGNKVHAFAVATWIFIVESPLIPSRMLRIEINDFFSQIQYSIVGFVTLHSCSLFLLKIRPLTQYCSK